MGHNVLKTSLVKVNFVMKLCTEALLWINTILAAHAGNDHS